MYSITRLYAVRKNTIDIFVPSDLTPAAFQQKTELNTSLYIAVDIGTKIIGINYSRLITDSNVCQLPNWDAIASAFTDELIIGYAEEIPGYREGTIIPREQVATWDVLGSLNTFDCNYADYLSEKEGLFAFRYNLKDLRIACQHSDTVKPVLANSIPFVNGMCCRPVYKEDSDKLYALGGAELCWQYGIHRTPEVMLADFSNLGDIEIRNIYFSKDVRDKRDFGLYFSNRTDTFTLDADWYLTSDYSFNEYTPIIVLGGILILPDSYTITGEYSLKFSLKNLPVHRARAYATYLKGVPNSEAEIAYATSSLEEYFTKELTRSDTTISAECFVILVKCPKIYVSRIGLDVWRNGLTINLFTKEGMLMHEATGTIRTYEAAAYTDRKELTIQNMEDLYVTDNLRGDAQLTIVPPDCRHHHFKNLQQSNCQMIYMMR